MPRIWVDSNGSWYAEKSRISRGRTLLRVELERERNGFSRTYEAQDLITDGFRELPKESSDADTDA